MDIKNVGLYKFTFIPMEKKNIRACDFYIVAENMEEAKSLLSYVECSEFFDQSMEVHVTKVMDGFVEVKG